MRIFVITRVITSSMVKWAVHVACTDAIRNVYKILIEKPDNNNA
jgi:hypothetical protein